MAENCGAELLLADDYGDNECTMRCMESPGHRGSPHREEFERGGRPVIVTWWIDERRVELAAPTEKFEADEVARAMRSRGGVGRRCCYCGKSMTYPRPLRKHEDSECPERPRAAPTTGTSVPKGTG